MTVRQLLVFDLGAVQHQYNSIFQQLHHLLSGTTILGPSTCAFESPYGKNHPTTLEKNRAVCGAPLGSLNVGALVLANVCLLSLSLSLTAALQEQRAESTARFCRAGQDSGTLFVAGEDSADIYMRCKGHRFKTQAEASPARCFAGSIQHPLGGRA